MTTTAEKALPTREILLVGPYGVLGTGVLDAAAADCIDTHQSFKRQLSKLREMRIIPQPSRTDWNPDHLDLFVVFHELMSLAPTCPQRVNFP
jgi:hypothetical protein